MTGKSILLTAAVAAVTCIVLDFVLPLKMDTETGKLSRINF